MLLLPFIQSEESDLLTCEQAALLVNGICHLSLQDFPGSVFKCTCSISFKGALRGIMVRS